MSDETASIFTVNILDVKITTVGDLQDVIKFVTWSITATKDGLTETAGNFITELPTPTVENFTPFAQLTQAQISSWIEANDERVPGIKSYVEGRLDIEVAKANLQSKPLPWAPVSTTSSSTNSST